MLESVDGVVTPVLGRIFLGLNAVEVFSKTVLSCDGRIGVGFAVDINSVEFGYISTKKSSIAAPG